MDCAAEMESWNTLSRTRGVLQNDDVVDVISVVIVNYNAGTVLRVAVGAVLNSSVPVEVLLVDNGSSDSSIERVRAQFGNDRRVRIIENRENLGFARANNIGLQRARGRYILVLNPDCIVEPETLERVRDHLEQEPVAGMAGCLLRNRDGTEQPGCRRSVPTPWRALVRVFHLDQVFPSHPRFRNFVLSREPLPDRPSFVEATSGAFMLVRREALKQVGLFDEGYFLHCEDLDWCMRFRKQNWRILFVADVEVTHYQGTCSVHRPIFVLWHKHKGMVRFYRKFFRHQYPLPLMALVVGAVWGRFVVLAFRSLPSIALRRAKSIRQPHLEVRRPRTRSSRHVAERRMSGPEICYRGRERRRDGSAPQSVRLP